MAHYKIKRTCFLAIENNEVIGSSRTGREFARQMSDIGKSHVWYSRKFSETDTFVHVLGKRVIYFHKVTL